ncbi:hypothetical protein [Streptomyces sp. NPDC056480]|uniref:hypothetical protein n=1 Tax=Streptomyces sp. NPDC056480 TaxID=3345833 RepID=UPI0036A4FDB1
MGVFAMFRRKKKDAAAVSSEETETGAVVPAADGGPETEAGTDAVEASTAFGLDTEKAAAAEGDGVDADEADEVETGAVASEVVEVVDVVEIPKQQSAEAAADNEAGEGARK